MKSICVGIDFGTTNTLVAYLEGRSESPTLSRLGRGNDSIPTTVTLIPMESSLLETMLTIFANMIHPVMQKPSNCGLAETGH